MAEILFPIGACAGWAAAGYRLWDLRKDRRNPALRALCAALICLAATATFAVPAVARLLDRIVGVPNLTILTAHLCVVLFSATVLRMLLFWSYPPAQARRRARRLVPAFTVTLLTMVVLFLLAPLEETTASLAGRYALYPYVAQYLLVYLSALTVGQAAVVYLGWRYARIAGRPWLRRGLRVTVVGAFAGMLFSLCKGVYVGALHLGVDLWYVEAVTPLLGAVSAMIGLAGLTMPAWGPHLTDLPAWLRRYRAYRQLAPLWLALYRAMPHIALLPPSSCRAWPTRDLDFLLYRRVIEIRDGRLALRPYFDDTVALTALRFAVAAGLDGAELHAAVEASVLAAALRAQHGEHTVDTAILDTPGGADLSGELDWLVPVAVAFAQSPVVQAVLTATETTPRDPHRRVADPDRPSSAMLGA